MFEVISYLPDGKTMAEACTLPVSVGAVPFASAAILAAPLEANQSALYDVSFTTKLAVPAGKPQTRTADLQGGIRILFSCSACNCGWGCTNGAANLATDLGTGLSDKSQMSCRAVAGLIPSKH